MSIALILDLFNRYKGLIILVALVLLMLIISYLVKVTIAQKKEIARQSINLEQVTKKDGSVLTLTVSEYRAISTPVTHKVDSLTTVANISIRAIKIAEVIGYTYKDTTKVEAIMDSPQEVAPPKPMTSKFYKIPVVVEEKCWGMKGFILTSDPKAKLTVTSRTATNSIQRLEVSKRFLGFLWFTKKSSFKAFTDCGEIKIDKINFIK